MSSVATSLPHNSVSPRRSDGTLLAVGAELKSWFGSEFAFWSRESGELVYAPEDLPWVHGALGELIGARAGELSQPQIVVAHDCFALVAVPLEDERRRRRLAAAPVATRHPATVEDVRDDAAWLEMPPDEVFRRLRKQSPLAVEALLRLSQAVTAKMEAETKSRRLEHEVAKISDNLASTYEEISLLYDITQNLRISSTDEQLGERALDWLAECLPAENLVLYLAPVAKESEITYRARTEPVLLSRGEPVIDTDQLQHLVQHLELSPGSGPLVANRNVTSTSRWKFKSIRELIVAPLGEGERLFGWLAAFNHRDDREFGTVEASLLNSVSAILGIHGCNIDLYRQQNEFLASVVRAFTSAIDAKDPYTCGHSDRVARVSVRLAQELGCDTDTAHTLYMAGLVHDIGKIGIADSVLRKPGRLTEAEFEHIKLHPELGYKILCDIKQLADVLPVVLHHHEQWDGRGYPHALAGEDIPYLARICAVADAYDAMTSDRPYRKGLPEEKVIGIFTEGAGSQWDREVVNAFFRTLDDIREISQRERAGLSLDVQRWAKLPGSPFRAE
jgi:HD-GYP domain-containing protein (c-di-GMP phosphodiesterase class II)